MAYYIPLPSRRIYNSAWKDLMLIKPKPHEDLAKIEEFYKGLQKYLLSEEDLRRNKYPMPDSEQDESGTMPQKEENLEPQEKTNGDAQKKVDLNGEPRVRVPKMCSRCYVYYYLGDDGFPEQNEMCKYHMGKVIDHFGIVRHGCCYRSVANNIEPCISSRYHITEDPDRYSVKGYLQTEWVPESFYCGYRVFALDCEMVYTNKGREVGRVTVVDYNLHIVYDKVVKLKNPILDYCTKYSGLTEKIMADATTSLEEVQSVICRNVNNRTILIGHGLENDLRVLKIIHGCVVDTSLVFPHHEGVPKKRSLRNLSFVFLNKIIQNNESGHSSGEDAQTCMELMRYKLGDKSVVREDENPEP